MTAGQFLVEGWHWEPTVFLGCISLLIGYAAFSRFSFSLRWIPFGLGVLVLLMALVSPLDTLGDTYLFSAHMLQHLLLLLVVPNLLLWGLSKELLDPFLRSGKPLYKLERVLSYPLIGWAVGVLIVWLWHWPVLYDATLKNEALHVAEHLSFLVAAVVFWWPVVSPFPKRRLNPLFLIVYLFTAGLANTILGVILTYTPAGIYPSYLHPSDWLGILPLIRTGWGFTPEIDQQIGGVLMWVLGGLFYLGSILGVLGRWYVENEKEIEFEYEMQGDFAN